MKKKDIKYIIKRILIGAGIILVVGMFKSKTTFALSKMYLNTAYNGSPNSTCGQRYYKDNACTWPDSATEISNEYTQFSALPVNFITYSSQFNLNSNNVNVITFKNSDMLNFNGIIFKLVLFIEGSDEYIIDKVYINSNSYNDSIFTVYSHLASETIENSAIDNNWRWYLYGYSDSSVDESSYLNTMFYNEVSGNLITENDNNLFYLYYPRIASNIYFQFKDNFFSMFKAYSNYNNGNFEFKFNNNDIKLYKEETSIDAFSQGMENGGGSWGPGILDNSGNTTTAKISTLFSFVRRPFKFLKDISTNSCSPLRLEMPFTNAEINLPCMSSVYSSVLGDYISIFKLLINGLFIYKIGINLIATIKNVISPSYDRIEVVDL